MKKVPMRTCIGCREIKPKKELIRILKSPEGDISIDFTGKKNGRGAYICSNGECFDKAVKSKRLSKEFDMQISNEVYEKLKDEIKRRSENE
jgi:predicted RNA-binding protein YlxR (DUF448 family)